MLAIAIERARKEADRLLAALKGDNSGLEWRLGWFDSLQKGCLMIREFIGENHTRFPNVCRNLLISMHESLEQLATDMASSALDGRDHFVRAIRGLGTPDSVARYPGLTICATNAECSLIMTFTYCGKNGKMCWKFHFSIDTIYLTCNDVEVDLAVSLAKFAEIEHSTLRTVGVTEAFDDISANLLFLWLLSLFNFFLAGKETKGHAQLRALDTRLKKLSKQIVDPEQFEKALALSESKLTTESVDFASLAKEISSILCKPDAFCAIHETEQSADLTKDELTELYLPPEGDEADVEYECVIGKSETVDVPPNEQAMTAEDDSKDLPEILVIDKKHATQGFFILVHGDEYGLYDFANCGTTALNIRSLPPYAMGESDADKLFVQLDCRRFLDECFTRMITRPIVLTPCLLELENHVLYLVALASVHVQAHPTSDRITKRSEVLIALKSYLNNASAAYGQNPSNCQHVALLQVVVEALDSVDFVLEKFKQVIDKEMQKSMPQSLTFPSALASLQGESDSIELISTNEEVHFHINKDRKIPTVIKFQYDTMDGQWICQDNESKITTQIEQSLHRLSTSTSQSEFSNTVKEILLLLFLASSLEQRLKIAETNRLLYARNPVFTKIAEYVRSFSSRCHPKMHSPTILKSISIAFWKIILGQPFQRTICQLLSILLANPIEKYDTVAESWEKFAEKQEKVNKHRSPMVLVNAKELICTDGFGEAYRLVETNDARITVQFGSSSDQGLQFSTRSESDISIKKKLSKMMQKLLTCNSLTLEQLHSYLVIIAAMKLAINDFQVDPQFLDSLSLLVPDAEKGSALCEAFKVSVDSPTRKIVNIRLMFRYMATIFCQTYETDFMEDNLAATITSNHMHRVAANSLEVESGWSSAKIISKLTKQASLLTVNHSVRGSSVKGSNSTRSLTAPEIEKQIRSILLFLEDNAEEIKLALILECFSALMHLVLAYFSQSTDLLDLMRLVDRWARLEDNRYLKLNRLLRLDFWRLFSRLPIILNCQAEDETQLSAFLQNNRMRLRLGLGMEQEAVDFTLGRNTIRLHSNYCTLHSPDAETLVVRDAKTLTELYASALHKLEVQLQSVDPWLGVVEFSLLGLCRIHLASLFPDKLACSISTILTDLQRLKASLSGKSFEKPLRGMCSIIEDLKVNSRYCGYSEFSYLSIFIKIRLAWNNPLEEGQANTATAALEEEDGACLTVLTEPKPKIIVSTEDVCLERDGKRLEKSELLEVFGLYCEAVKISKTMTCAQITAIFRNICAIVLALCSDLPIDQLVLRKRHYLDLVRDLETSLRTLFCSCPIFSTTQSLTAEVAKALSRTDGFDQILGEFEQQFETAGSLTSITANEQQGPRKSVRKGWTFTASMSVKEVEQYLELTLASGEVVHVTGLSVEVQQHGRKLDFDEIEKIFDKRLIDAYAACTADKVEMLQELTILAAAQICNGYQDGTNYEKPIISLKAFVDESVDLDMLSNAAKDLLTALTSPAFGVNGLAGSIVKFRKVARCFADYLAWKLDSKLNVQEQHSTSIELDVELPAGSSIQVTIETNRVEISTVQCYEEAMSALASLMNHMMSRVLLSTTEFVNSMKVLAVLFMWLRYKHKSPEKVLHELVATFIPSMGVNMSRKFTPMLGRLEAILLKVIRWHSTLKDLYLELLDDFATIIPPPEISTFNVLIKTSFVLSHDKWARVKLHTFDEVVDVVEIDAIPTVTLAKNGKPIDTIELATIIDCEVTEVMKRIDTMNPYRLSTSRLAIEILVDLYNRTKEETASYVTLPTVIRPVRKGKSMASFFEDLEATKTECRKSWTEDLGVFKNSKSNFKHSLHEVQLQGVLCQQTGQKQFHFATRNAHQLSCFSVELTDGNISIFQYSKITESDAKHQLSTIEVFTLLKQQLQQLIEQFPSLSKTELIHSRLTLLLLLQALKCGCNTAQTAEEVHVHRDLWFLAYELTACVSTIQPQLANFCDCLLAMAGEKMSHLLALSSSKKLAPIEPRNFLTEWSSSDEMKRLFRTLCIRADVLPFFCCMSDGVSYFQQSTQEFFSVEGNELKRFDGSAFRPEEPLNLFDFMLSHFSALLLESHASQLTAYLLILYRLRCIILVTETETMEELSLACKAALTPANETDKTVAKMIQIFLAFIVESGQKETELRLELMEVIKHAFPSPTNAELSEASSGVSLVHDNHENLRLLVPIDRSTQCELEVYRDRIAVNKVNSSVPPEKKMTHPLDDESLLYQLGVLVQQLEDFAIVSCIPLNAVKRMLLSIVVLSLTCVQKQRASRLPPMALEQVIFRLHLASQNIKRTPIGKYLRNSMQLLHVQMNQMTSCSINLPTFLRDCLTQHVQLFPALPTNTSTTKRSINFQYSGVDYLTNHLVLKANLPGDVMVQLCLGNGGNVQCQKVIEADEFQCLQSADEILQLMSRWLDEPKPSCNTTVLCEFWLAFIMVITLADNEGLNASEDKLRAILSHIAGPNEASMTYLFEVTWVKVSREKVAPLELYGQLRSHLGPLSVPPSQSSRLHQVELLEQYEDLDKRRVSFQLLLSNVLNLSIVLGRETIAIAKKTENLSVLDAKQKLHFIDMTIDKLVHCKSMELSVTGLSSLTHLIFLIHLSIFSDPTSEFTEMEQLLLNVRRYFELVARLFPSHMSQIDRLAEVVLEMLASICRREQNHLSGYFHLKQVTKAIMLQNHTFWNSVNVFDANEPTFIVSTASGDSGCMIMSLVTEASGRHLIAALNDQTTVTVWDMIHCSLVSTDALIALFNEEYEALKNNKIFSPRGFTVLIILWLLIQTSPPADATLLLNNLVALARLGGENWTNLMKKFRERFVMEVEGIDRSRLRFLVNLFDSVLEVKDLPHDETRNYIPKNRITLFSSASKMCTLTRDENEDLRMQLGQNDSLVTLILKFKEGRATLWQKMENNQLLKKVGPQTTLQHLGLALDLASCCLTMRTGHPMECVQLMLIFLLLLAVYAQFLRTQHERSSHQRFHQFLKRSQQIFLRSRHKHLFSYILDLVCNSKLLTLDTRIINQVIGPQIQQRLMPTPLTSYPSERCLAALTEIQTVGAFELNTILVAFTYPHKCLVCDREKKTLHTLRTNGITERAHESEIWSLLQEEIKFALTGAMEALFSLQSVVSLLLTVIGLLKMMKYLEIGLTLPSEFDQHRISFFHKLQKRFDHDHQALNVLEFELIKQVDALERENRSMADTKFCFEDALLGQMNQHVDLLPLSEKNATHLPSVSEPGWHQAMKQSSAGDLLLERITMVDLYRGALKFGAQTIELEFVLQEASCQVFNRNSSKNSPLQINAVEDILVMTLEYAEDRLPIMSDLTLGNMVQLGCLLIFALRASDTTQLLPHVLLDKFSSLISSRYPLIAFTVSRFLCREPSKKSLESMLLQLRKSFKKFDSHKQVYQKEKDHNERTLHAIKSQIEKRRLRTLLDDMLCPTSTTVISAPFSNGDSNMLFILTMKNGESYAVKVGTDTVIMNPLSATGLLTVASPECAERLIDHNLDELEKIGASDFQRLVTQLVPVSLLMLVYFSTEKRSRINEFKQRLQFYQQTLVQRLSDGVFENLINLFDLVGVFIGLDGTIVLECDFRQKLSTFYKELHNIDCIPIDAISFESLFKRQQFTRLPTPLAVAEKGDEICFTWKTILEPVETLSAIVTESKITIKRKGSTMAMKLLSSLAKHYLQLLAKMAFMDKYQLLVHLTTVLLILLAHRLEERNSGQLAKFLKHIHNLVALEQGPQWNMQFDLQLLTSTMARGLGLLFGRFNAKAVFVTMFVQMCRIMDIHYAAEKHGLAQHKPSRCLFPIMMHQPRTLQLLNGFGKHLFVILEESDFRVNEVYIGLAGLQFSKLSGYQMVRLVKDCLNKLQQASDNHDVDLFVVLLNVAYLASLAFSVALAAGDERTNILQGIQTNVKVVLSHCWKKCDEFGQSCIDQLECYTDDVLERMKHPENPFNLNGFLQKCHSALVVEAMNARKQKAFPIPDGHEPFEEQTSLSKCQKLSEEQAHLFARRKSSDAIDILVIRKRGGTLSRFTFCFRGSKLNCLAKNNILNEEEILYECHAIYRRMRRYGAECDLKLLMTDLCQLHLLFQTFRSHTTSIDFDAKMVIILARFASLCRASEFSFNPYINIHAVRLAMSGFIYFLTLGSAFKLTPFNLYLQFLQFLRSTTQCKPFGLLHPDFIQTFTADEITRATDLFDSASRAIKPRQRRTFSLAEFSIEKRPDSNIDMQYINVVWPFREDLIEEEFYVCFSARLTSVITVSNMAPGRLLDTTELLEKLRRAVYHLNRNSFTHGKKIEVIQFLFLFSQAILSFMKFQRVNELFVVWETCFHCARLSRISSSQLKKAFLGLQRENDLAKNKYERFCCVLRQLVTGEPVTSQAQLQSHEPISNAIQTTATERTARHSSSLKTLFKLK